MDTKALRQKILDLAIRGKLVPQDPNDEPASVLLEKIRAEKQQMVKDGRLKAKDIKNDTIIFKGEDNLHYEKFQDGTVKCIEDEIPFEVPEGWEWSRANCISDVRDGTHDTPAYVEKGVPLITSKNLTPAGVDYSNVKYISVEDATQINQRSGVDVGDILFAMIGTIGNPKLVTENTLISIKNVALFKFSYSSDLSHHYILRVLEYLQEQMKENPSGGLQPFVSLNRLRTTLLPIAPITEQNRIVEKLENLLRKVDLINYDCDELDTLIKAVKSKILDLAIRGQLVPQDPNDEPASVLLERIRAEKEELIKAGKIKRDKKESIIFKGDDNSYYEKIGDKIRCIDAEIPFDLPELWTFARLKHIGGIVGGGTPKTNISKYWDGNIPWLTPADLSGYDSMYISTGSRTITDFGLKSSSAQMLPANSILYSSRAPIGYTAIATIPVCTNQGFKSVVPYDFSMSPYLYYCLRARTDNIIQRATGTTFKEISGSEMAETIIPIPPLNEQSKIIEKVTQLQEVISLIEKSLN